MFWQRPPPCSCYGRVIFFSLPQSRIDKFLSKSHFPVFLTQFFSYPSCPVQYPKHKKELPVGVCPRAPRRTSQPAPSAGGQWTPPLSGPGSPIYPGPCHASPNPTQHLGAARGSLPQAGRGVKAPETEVSGREGGRSSEEGGFGDGEGKLWSLRLAQGGIDCFWLSQSPFQPP